MTKLRVTIAALLVGAAPALAQSSVGRRADQPRPPNGKIRWLGRAGAGGGYAYGWDPGRKLQKHPSAEPERFGMLESRAAQRRTAALVN